MPEPIFKEYSGGLVVIFKFKEPMRGVSKAELKTARLNTRQEKILALLQKGNSLNAHEIRSLLEPPPSIRTMNVDLALLKKLGYVEQQGKGRSTAWKAKL